MFVKNKKELIWRFRESGGHIDVREHTDEDNYGWAAQTVRDWCSAHHVQLALDGPHIFETLGSLSEPGNRRAPISKENRRTVFSRDTMMVTIPNTVRDQAIEDYGMPLNQFKKEHALITVQWIEVPYVGKGIWVRLVPP